MLHRLLLSLGFSAILVTNQSLGQQKKDSPAKDSGANTERKLDANSFRLKVEPILEPFGEVAIYRIQIWALEKREVCLHIKASSAGHGGLFRNGQDAKLYRADFVIMALLRDPEMAKKLGKNVEFEFRSMIGGDRGMTLIADEVDASLQLKQLIEFRMADGVHKMGSRVSVGQFRGKPVEVTVD